MRMLTMFHIQTFGKIFAKKSFRIGLYDILEISAQLLKIITAGLE